MIKDYVFTFSKDNEPVKKANPGETLKFKTLDCFCNQVEKEEDKVSEIDFSRANPATGPVYIEGAEPGDTLVVDILDIDVADTGVIVAIPELGPLHDKVEMRTKVMKIDENGKTNFNGIEFEVEPMIGVIGTAPKEGEVPCGMWGDHGGNMDNKKIVKNTRLYLPVNVDGALFQLGDLHASMGDGELCGTGIEVQGVVTVKLDLIKDFKINRPVHVDDEKWYTIANAETYDEALRLATMDMLELMMDAYGWDETDVYMYMSIQGDVEIAQGVKPSPGDMVVRFGIPKIEDKPLIK